MIAIPVVAALVHGGTHRGCARLFGKWVEEQIHQEGSPRLHANS